MNFICPVIYYSALFVIVFYSPGSKKFDSLTTQAASSSTESTSIKLPPVQKFKRSDKRHPREASSKKKVSVIREIKVAKRTTRDPRFDELSGTFEEETFKNSFQFIKDIRSEEKEQLQNELKKCKVPQRKDQIVRLINKMNTAEKANQLKAEKQKLKSETRKRAFENVKQGKNPYFAKQSELRKSELKSKFEKLKKEGKVDKYLAKRRKQNLQKDKKSL